MVEQAWPRGCISEVWEGETARELGVHVVVAKNVVVDARTTQVREIEGSIQNEHLPEVRSGETRSGHSLSGRTNREPYAQWWWLEGKKDVVSGFP